MTEVLHTVIDRLRGDGAPSALNDTLSIIQTFLFNHLYLFLHHVPKHLNWIAIRAAGSPSRQHVAPRLEKPHAGRGRGRGG
jgi:hypothetical protein